MVKRVITSVEFIYCACGCGKTKPKYDSQGRTSKYIKGHHIKGPNNMNWKNGEYQDPQGYIYVLRPKHRFADCRGYVYKHRVVYEDFYNCCLLKGIHIHHINGIRHDNRIENLQPLTSSQHGKITSKKDLSNRTCKLCNSTTTYVNKKTGLEAWVKYEEGFICRKCYDKIYDKYKRKRNKKKT